jgi:hypothetical protein
MSLRSVICACTVFVTLMLAVPVDVLPSVPCVAAWAVALSAAHISV